jgi:hypothetical protein
MVDIHSYGEAAMVMRAIAITITLAVVLFAGMADAVQAQTSGKGVCSSMCDCDIQCIDVCGTPCSSSCAQKAAEMRRQCRRTCTTCNTLLQRKKAAEDKSNKK